MSKLFYIKPDRKQGKYVLKLGRLELSRLIKLVTGHNGLFYFRSKVDPEISSICRFCMEEDECFFHLVNDCPRFFLTRRDIFLDRLICNDHEWSVRQLIDFSFSLGINDALEGDTRIGLFATLGELSDDALWDSDSSSPSADD